MGSAGSASLSRYLVGLASSTSGVSVKKRKHPHSAEKRVTRGRCYSNFHSEKREDKFIKFISRTKSFFTLHLKGMVLGKKKNRCGGKLVSLLRGRERKRSKFDSIFIHFAVVVHWRRLGRWFSAKLIF